MNRISRIRALAAATLMATLCQSVIAETYPVRPIRVIVPFAAAGNVDIVQRLMAEGISKELGQPVITENLAGGNSVIGSMAALRAPRDGYTILATSSLHVMLPTLQKSVPYVPLTDFVPVSQVTEMPMVLVSSSLLPANTYAEFVKWAKSKKDGIDYGTLSGSASHLAAEMWKERTGIDARAVPYRAASSASIDLQAGRISMTFVTIATTLGPIRSGKVRALAIAADRRSPLLPDVPTFAELGVPDMEVSTWHGYFLPKGAPKEVLDRLASAISKTANSEEIRTKFVELGGRPVGSKPADFATFAAKEERRWADMAKKTGMEPE